LGELAPGQSASISDILTVSTTFPRLLDETDPNRTFLDQVIQLHSETVSLCPSPQQLR